MASLFSIGKAGLSSAGGERNLFNCLIKKLPYISVIACIISISAYFCVSLLEPQYRSEATVFVDVGPAARQGSGVSIRPWLRRDIVAAQAQLLLSADLARPVIQKLGLSDRPGLAGNGFRLSSLLRWMGLRRDRLSSSPDERALEAFSQALTVFPDAQSSTVSLAFVSPDPQLAAAVPNALAEEYVALTEVTRSATNSPDVATLRARLVAKSVVPAEPSFPRAVPVAATIGLLALVALVGGALWRELAKARRARREAPLVLPEVADLTHVAVSGRRMDSPLGAAPGIADAPSLAPELDNCRGSSVAAAAKAIIAAGFKRIMIATMTDADGDAPRSVGVMLARAIASADRRTVLIDLHDDDAISRNMGDGAPLPGFSDLFAGEASFGQVIFRARESRVHFIPAGLRPDVREMLTSDRVRPLVSALDHTYDHVIVEVAEDLVATMAPLCDAVVVVGSMIEPNRRAAASVISHLRAKTDAEIILLSPDASALVTATTDISEVVKGEAA